MEKIDLDYPVTVGGKEIKQLTMRRPKVIDQKVANKSAASDADRETVLFANLCGVESAVMDELDMLDYQKVQETYTGFLSPAQK
jgi:hypothetical protein